MPKKPTNQPATAGTIEPTTAVVKVEAKEFARAKISLPVLGQLVVDLQHNLHRATAHTKTRGEVAGSTKKPWRQKGTGRARVGTRRTPLWRGGGRVFGPRSERNFQHKINRRLLLPAVSTALAQKALAGEVSLINQPYTGGQQTRSALQFLSSTLDPKSNLLIIAEVNPALQQATRNLSYLTVRTASQVNLLDVVATRQIIFLGDALPVLIARLNK